MRADRLVALLLLLQRQGTVTAAQAAAELEVSERTARRDLDALRIAGLPVYSTRGRNGGWKLAGGGRTDLSGLTESEVRALFLLAGPSQAATPEIRAALRKMVRALPESFRTTAEAAARSVVVDRSGWDGTSRNVPDPPHLGEVQRAVVEGRQAVLGYVSRDGSATTRVVNPLGLAVKGSAWYLVADTDAGQRTFRLDRVTSVEVTTNPVLRPEGFDLEETWSSITAAAGAWRDPARVRAAAAKDVLSTLRFVFGSRLLIGPARDDSYVEVEIRGLNPRALAGEIAGFGAAVEVLEPSGVRDLMTSIANELCALYVS